MSETTRRQFLPGLAALPAMAKSKPVPRPARACWAPTTASTSPSSATACSSTGCSSAASSRRKKRAERFRVRRRLRRLAAAHRPRAGSHRAPKRPTATTARCIARPDIDGVVIAVPDHWHYPMASQALLAGKDVYLEKPMTYTVEEAAKLNDLVERTKARAPGGRHRARPRGSTGRPTSTSVPARWARCCGASSATTAIRARACGTTPSPAPAATTGPTRRSPPAATSTGTCGSVPPASAPSARSATSAGASSGTTPAATPPTCSTTAWA